MEWHVIVALVVAIPIILFPAAFLWYLNAGGLYHAMRATLGGKARRAAGPTAVGTVVEHRVPVGTAGK